MTVAVLFARAMARRAGGEVQDAQRKIGIYLQQKESK